MISILIAGAVALVVSLAGTPLVIDYFKSRGFGQIIREDGPETHHAKAGTPTMGGTAVVVAAVLGYLLAHVRELRFTPGGLLIVLTFVGMGMVGFADDFIKVRMRRNLGLNKTAKFVGQGLIAAAFAFVGPAVAGMPTDISVAGDLAVELPSRLVFLAWIFVLLAGTSNAVNLTDGLDGLAAGSAAMVFGAFMLIAFWQWRNPCAYIDIVPCSPTFVGAEFLELAVIAAAGMGACAGFLWHNAPPAAIFMGDTGSLALGGLMAGLGVATGTQVLLVLLGGLFVVEALSVITQVVAFRGFGTRVLRMAPIHHHFELLGWQETTIIVRFWIVTAMGIALGLGAFYFEFLRRTGAV